MPLYAHAHLEDPRSGVKYSPGDAVPEDLPGVDELLEGGAIGPAKPERNVVANSDGRVIREIDADGVVTRPAGGYVKRFDGDVTAKDIRDPDVETPLVGVHTSEAEHRVQDPGVYSADDAGGQD